MRGEVRKIMCEVVEETQEENETDDDEYGEEEKEKEEEEDDDDDDVHKYGEEEEEDDDDDDNGEKKRSLVEGQHKHRLEYVKEGFAQRIKCVKCGFFIPEHRSCYACGSCSYTVHEPCATLPRTISGHPCHIFPHRLTLTLRPPSSRGIQCYYCRETIRAGNPYYTCNFCANSYPRGANYFMHTTCALIPLPGIWYDRDAECMYICHRRRMLLAVDSNEENDALCYSCRSPQWGGPAYHCTGSPRCKNFFHKSCAELPESIRHPSHPDHDLWHVLGRPETCEACGKTGCRHVYYCTDRMMGPRKYRRECVAFVLGAECAFSGARMPSHLVTSHEHELILEEGRPGVFRCNGCQRSHCGAAAAAAAEVQRTRDISFRCEECIFNLHFLCGPLPSTAEFGCHIHPLHLIDSLIEDDSGEYYCDVCEEERDPRFRVYYCAPCKFIAHIHCLVPEIMKFLKEESPTNIVELVILGESSLINGSTGIDHFVKAAEESDNPTEDQLFFSDIVRHLTREEKEKLSNIYKESDNSSTSRKSHLSLTTNHHQGTVTRIMSFLESSDKIEGYVDIAGEFFRLDPTNFSELCSGLSCLKPEKAFELDKYLSMKVVDVGGYKVPWALASDLNTLLLKYGNDLGGDSSLTPQMKSTTATMLCAVINSMRSTLAEDMSIDDLKRWFFNLKLVKRATGYVIKELDCFEESVITSFLGFQAIRIERDTTASLDLEIAQLEAELENRKEKRERFKECVSAKSDLMKECLRNASRLKWKTIHKLF